MDGFETLLMYMGLFSMIAVIVIYKLTNMPDTIQEVQKQTMVSGTTVFSFTKPTPMWATWVFRAEFILNKAVTMYLTGTGAIEEGKVKEYLLIMSIVDFLVWFGARSLGVKKSDIETELS